MLELTANESVELEVGLAQRRVDPEGSGLQVILSGYILPLRFPANQFYPPSHHLPLFDICYWESPRIVVIKKSKLT